ncbi:hypothetical protein [Teichococcus aerofrigidensis]
MSALTPATRERLVKILGLLGSDIDGERAAAALAAHRLIQKSGTTWEALLATSFVSVAPVPPPPRPSSRKHRGFSESGLRDALRDVAVQSLSKHLHLLTAEEQSMARTVIDAAWGVDSGRWNKHWQQKFDYLSAVIRRRKEEAAA